MTTPREDYYAVLQVQADAEPEVIEAAYRQLMRKYHPDVAGSDRERAADLHERAKTLNRAYAVLRDSERRSLYDRKRNPWAASPPPPASQSGSHARSRTASARPEPRHTAPPGSVVGARPEPTTVRPVSAQSATHVALGSPLLDAISTVYYLLPGPYEWERGRERDLSATLMLPLLGLAGFSLASGRLHWLTGTSPYVATAAWAALGLLALPLWRLLPRLMLAGFPTVLLLIGPVDGLVRFVGLAPWLAWSATAALGIVLSARLYLFAVVPTIALCWILANAGPVQAAVWPVVAGVGASVSTSQFGLVTVACLIGMLCLLTVLEWRQTPHRANKPMFRRISANRVRTLQSVPLRTDRDHREPPSVTLAARQEANVVLIRDPWAFLQTDDGREGWADWSVVVS